MQNKDPMYLNDIWFLYFHEPFDTNWDLKSYKFLCTISNVDDYIQVFHAFKPLFFNGMFFIMREHISPRWEDENNINGGCFSFKVNKNVLHEKIFEICSQMMGETLGKKTEFSLNINGISISPKKNYYIFRIWIKDSSIATSHNYNIRVPKYSTLMFKHHSEPKDI